MNRSHFFLPTGERITRVSEFSSPNVCRCVAERVLQRTAQAWVLPPPTTASAPAMACAKVAFPRQRDASHPACR